MNPNSDKKAHEQEPSDLGIGISIRGLGKVFKVTTMYNNVTATTGTISFVRVHMLQRLL